MAVLSNSFVLLACFTLPKILKFKVWKRFTQFEQTYGDLASMLKTLHGDPNLGVLTVLAKTSNRRSAWRRSPTFVKAPASKEDPRAVHAPFSGRRLHLTRRRVRAREAFSGDAPPPPASPAADQHPYLPGSPIRALHVPLLGIFVSVSPPNSLSGEVPATFSPPQSLHVPWEVFFYLSGGTTSRSEAVSLFRWCHAAI
ncbi:hypothetical protein CK203_103282 [Vitis vinifera]|uniref:Uncharacterized protein n=1 Tax=Vitis vinifera TaxID=29760 RepID=A0A438FI15_VITVI|nr:hypothetical protein CK203_103282 [Vitis vinifera]